MKADASPATGSRYAELVQIPHSHIDGAWKSAEPLLRKAHDRAECDSPERFRDRLRARECDLWGVYLGGRMVAAAISSIRGKTATIEAVGGALMRDWVHLVAEFEDLARANGMEQIEIEGRDWSRVLSGYKVKRVILGKAL